MQNAEVSNPNDLKVVSFHNSTTFDFTPELGCMFDGRAINGKSGAPGIQAGETMVLPYHVGRRLAVNLAKRVMNTSPAATVDPKGVPTGVPIWSESKLDELANTYLTDMYAEAKPVAQSQTDLLMAKVEEYKAMVDKLLPKVEPEVIEAPAVESVSPGLPVEVVKTEVTTYQDKQEVIAELEKRDIRHDKRKSKAELEKLLV